MINKQIETLYEELDHLILKICLYLAYFCWCLGVTAT